MLGRRGRGVRGGGVRGGGRRGEEEEGEREEIFSPFGLEIVLLRVPTKI